VMGTQNNQMALPISGDDKKSFDNFLIGKNQELVAALQDFPQAQEHRVVFFYGKEGSGKTHLGLSAARASQALGRSTHFLSLSDPNIIPELLEVIDVAGLVCVDDADAWAGDSKKERALFTLFEQIKHAGGILFISAKHSPEACGFTLRDLVSRLGSGLIYSIAELDDAERLEALKMRARHRGLSVNDDALKYLVTRLSRNSHELFKFLDHMDKASLVEKRKITIPFLQSLLQNQS